ACYRYDFLGTSFEEFSGSGSLSSSLHQGLTSYCVLELALLGHGLFPAVPMLFHQWSSSNFWCLYIEGPVGQGSFGIGLDLIKGASRLLLMNHLKIL
ncbi:4944_t:CDS:2, partial [Gigaspora rosea]